MRVLHIGKFFTPEVGGIETFLLALSREQAKNGHDVHVFVCKNDRHLQNMYEHNLKVKRHNIQAYITNYAPLSLSLLCSIIKQCYGKNRPQVIHVHSPNIAALWVALFCFQPIIVHWHSDVIFPDKQINALLLYFWRIIEKFILKRAKRIIVTSQNYLESSLFLQNVREKCVVVPLALPDKQESIDIDHSITSFFNKHHNLNLLSVGRLTHYKGFKVLLEALQGLPNVRLCLVGTGELQEELELYIKKYDLQERVLMTNYVNEATLQICYEYCDIVVLPSILRTEAFGMVLLEAMRAGKACIATNVHGSGMSEVVQDGLTGIIAKQNDSRDLASIITFLSQNKELCSEMGKKGKERFENNYSISIVQKEISKVYNIANDKHSTS